MAGSGKAKRKNHQGKSDARKAPNPHRNQDGNSGSNIDVGKERGKNVDKSKQSGGKTVPVPIMCRDSGETPSKMIVHMMSEGGSIASTLTLLEGKAPCVPNPQVNNNASNSSRTESSAHSSEFSSLDLIKFLTNCPNERDLEDWLASRSEDSRYYAIKNLAEKVEYLTTHVMQWRDYAEKIMRKLPKDNNDRKIVLRNMRLQSNERESLLKQKEKLDSFSSILTEKENYLRMVNQELERVNQAMKRLQEALSAINNIIEAESDQSSSPSKSKETLLKARKTETEILKMSKETERQISELKIQFAEEGRRIVELEQKLKLIDENHDQAKANPSHRC